MDTPKIIPRSSQTLRDNVYRMVFYYFGWLTLFFVMGWLSRLLIPQVKKLTAKEQMFWKLAMVRAICGFLTVWGIKLAYLDKQLGIDHILSTTDESWTFISILTSFFVFEELTLIYFDMKFRTFSKELHMHHFFAFNGFFLAAYSNCGHYYAARAFVLEASTPFSCVCWCLLKLKLENTTIWRWNQWILINVFHMRSFVEFSWWYDIYQQWDNIKTNLPLLYTVNMLVGLTIVSLWLTPYWTYRKTVQYFYPTDWSCDNKKEKLKDETQKTS